MADGADPDPDQVAFCVSRVSLEISMQCSVMKRADQRIVRARKMIHTDVNVPGLGEPFDCRSQDIQFLLAAWKLRLKNTALRKKEVRQVGVVEYAEAVRTHLQQTVQRGGEATGGLQRQSIDQVNVSGPEPLCPGMADKRKCLLT